MQWITDLLTMDNKCTFTSPRESMDPMMCSMEQVHPQAEWHRSEAIGLGNIFVSDLPRWFNASQLFFMKVTTPVSVRKPALAGLGHWLQRYVLHVAGRKCYIVTLCIDAML